MRPQGDAKPYQAGSATPTRTIALMNQKGGVGKTTTTVNLAAAVARAGRRVLVVDLDPQAHATLHLGVDPAEASDQNVSAYDLLTDPATGGDAGIAVGENLTLIPSETNLAGAETELAGAEGAQTRLRDALLAATRDAEFVFIDCPPSLGLLTVAGLCAAREVIIPMQAHFLALQGVGKLLETITALRGTSDRPGFNPRLRVSGVVLCMHDKQASHTQEVVRDLEDFFEQSRQSSDLPWRYARVYNPTIRRNIKLAECPSFGQTIFDYAPQAPGAQDYAALAQTLIAEWDRMLERRTERNGTIEVTPSPAARIAAE